MAERTGEQNTDKITSPIPRYPRSKHSTVPPMWKKFRKYGDLCILHSEVSQSSKRFRRCNNLQGSANAIAALIYSRLSTPSNWCPIDIDGVLEFGCCLYKTTLKHLENKCIVYLEPNEIFRYFYVLNYKFTICVDKELCVVLRLEEEPYDTFLKTLRNYFIDKQELILSIQHRHQYAIWLDPDGCFVFDPYDNEADGRKLESEPKQYGCCTNFCLGPPFSLLVRAQFLEPIIKYLWQRIDMSSDSAKITLYSMTVEKMVRVNTEPPECLDMPPPPIPPKPDAVPPPPPPPPPPPAHKDSELTAWQQDEPIDESKIPVERVHLPSSTNFLELVFNESGILRGSTHQADPAFSRWYTGMQSLGNAVAALTMLRISKSKYWTKKIVDDVLRMGEKIHHKSKSLPNFGICDKIEWENREFAPKVEHYAAFGDLISKKDNILDLHAALKDFLHDHDCTIVMGPLTLAVWIEDDLYYMYDPNERDAKGKKDLNPWNAPGAACITWFKNLKDLVNLYMENVDRIHREDRFHLSKVIIEDYKYYSEDWYNFKSFAKNHWILRGNFSQNSKRFARESRNNQGTGIAAIALLYSTLIDEKNWEEDTIDKILMEGDEYYRKSVEDLKLKGTLVNPRLLTSELLAQFPREHDVIKLQIEECAVLGLVNVKDTHPDAKNLLLGLNDFFNIYISGIIISHNVSMAIWKTDFDYFYFDSHTLDENGVVAGFGTAACLRFVNIEDLAKQILSNLEPDGDDSYNISVLVPYKLPVDDLGKVKLPLQNYMELSRTVALLCSKYSEVDDKFEKTKGKQSVPMVLAALGYNLLRPGAEWSENDIDQVLMEGDKIYKKSLELFLKSKDNDVVEEEEVVEENEEEDEAMTVVKKEDPDRITTENVLKEFVIGLNKFTMTIETVGKGTMADDFENVIVEFFETEQGTIVKPDVSYAIFENELFTAALWTDDFKIYLFDPKPRDNNGEVFGKSEWPQLPPEIEGEEEGEGGERNLFDYALLAEQLGGGDMDYALLTQKPITKSGLDINNEETEEDGGVEKVIVPKAHSQHYWDTVAKDRGKACILQFSGITDLILHLLENSPPTKRGIMQFTLQKVTIKNEPYIKEIHDPDLGPKKDEIAGDWYNFKEVAYGRWILRARYSMLNELFLLANRGKQLIPMCYTAIAYSYLYTYPKYTSRTVDYILNYGDKLYSATLRKLKERMRKDSDKTGYTFKQIEALINYDKYTIRDFRKKFCIQEHQITLEVNYDEIQGDLHADDEMNLLNVKKAIQQLFDQYRFGILESRGVSVALIRINNIYYMFDPDSRGPNGTVSLLGTACITRFLNIEDLTNIYLQNVPREGSTLFTIHPVTIVLSQCPRERQPEKSIEYKPIGGFSPVIPGKWVLRGELRPTADKYDRGSHRASTAIAFVALSLSLVHKVECWTAAMVDDILLYGQELYTDSIKFLEGGFNSWAQSLDINLVLKDFKIGTLDVNVQPRDMEQRGYVDVKTAKHLNLRTGLQKFFQENTHGVLQMDRLIVAIWEDESEDNQTYIYLFDPNARGLTGLPFPQGTACCVKFLNYGQVFDHIMACLPCPDKTGLPFIITPLEIVVGDCRTPKKKPVDWEKRSEAIEAGITPLTKICKERKKANAAQKLYRKLLLQERKRKLARKQASYGRKSFYQVDDDFWIIRGLHRMCPCRDIPTNYAAFVLFTVKQPKEWNYKSIETILDCGEQLYIDSIVTYNPTEKFLTLSYVLRRVIMNGKILQLRVFKPLPCGEFTAENLINSLWKFFQQLNIMLLNYKKKWITIFVREGFYYYFDPYGRNLEGKSSQGKDEKKDTAVLMKFGSIELMAEIIYANFADENEEPGEFFFVLLELNEVPPKS